MYTKDYYRKSALPSQQEPRGIIIHEPLPSVDNPESKHLFVLAANMQLLLDLVHLGDLGLTSAA